MNLGKIGSSAKSHTTSETHESLCPSMQFFTLSYNNIVNPLKKCKNGIMITIRVLHPKIKAPSDMDKVNNIISDYLNGDQVT